MKYSKSFIKTYKEVPKEAIGISSALLLRGGYIAQEMSGVYSLLPLGFSVQQKICGIIREEMKNIDGREIQMPALQPKSLWEETGRWDKIDPPLFKFKDRHEKDIALGSTHEEVVTDLARRFINSFKDLPQMVYQIQTKFRNEIRATGGLLRTREFLMKDAYSFHVSEDDFNDYYDKVSEAYKKIFKRVGIDVKVVEAHSGSIGGKKSNEFMLLSDAGEDKIYLCGACDWAANAELVADIKECPKCGGKIESANAIEVGHIFMLGDLYSEKMKANFTDADGKSKPLFMGCYGIGIGRLLSSIVEVNHDEAGIIWPKAVAPVTVYLIDLEGSKGEEVYKKLTDEGFEVLFDDREVAAGVKFADADLLGIPYRVVVSSKTLKENSVEIKERGVDKEELVSIDKVISKLR